MDLTQFDNEYSQATAEGVAVTLPEGDYDVTMTDFEFFLSKEGRPLLRLDFTVAEGEFKGNTFNKFYQLDNPGRMSFLKKDMVVMGVLVPKVSQLPDALTQAKGVGLRVRAKINGKYTNYFINGRSTIKASDCTPETPF